MTLKVAPGLALPDEAVTQTFGVLAVRGAGKTNTAVVMAEEMAAAGLPFVVVDPVGVWWGLRSAADGKSAGIALPIFGGRHGDVPLEKTGGQLIADVVVDERLSCVLDVSEFSEGDKTRFLIDFGERLYRRNEHPLHLFLEEADDYAPQRPFREQARLLRVWENIVRRGRSRGLGITLITQRSAALNKNVLTQIETLVVLRTTSPQDRKAIAGWVEYHGQSKELLASLPGLANGEAWFWSPSWLGALQRVKVRKRRTFDSSATPKQTKTPRRPATLADVDLGALEQRMAETIERAKESDPKELQRRIRELERDLKAALNDTPAPAEPTIVEVPVLDQALAQSVLTAVDKAVAAVSTTVDGAFAPLRKIAADVEAAVAKVGDVGKHAERALPAGRARAVSPATTARTADRGRIDPAEPGHGVADRVGDPVRPTTPDVVDDVKIGAGERRVLAVLRSYPDGRTHSELAMLTGYSAKASTLNVILSKLRRVGWVEQGQPIRLSAAGLDAAGGHEAMPTGDALFDYWMQHPRMGAGERKVLEVLVEHWPTYLSHVELCDLAGYSPDASTMNVILSKLRKLGLVAKASRALAPEFAEAIGL